MITTYCGVRGVPAGFRLGFFARFLGCSLGEVDTAGTAGTDGNPCRNSTEVASDTDTADATDMGTADATDRGATDTAEGMAAGATDGSEASEASGVEYSVR